MIGLGVINANVSHVVKLDGTNHINLPLEMVQRILGESKLRFIIRLKRTTFINQNQDIFYYKGMPNIGVARLVLRFHNDNTLSVSCRPSGDALTQGLRVVRTTNLFPVTFRYMNIELEIDSLNNSIIISVNGIIQPTTTTGTNLNTVFTGEIHDSNAIGARETGAENLAMDISLFQMYVNNEIVCNYEMNEGSGTMIKDNIGGYNATLIDGQWSSLLKEENNLSEFNSEDE